MSNKGFVPIGYAAGIVLIVAALMIIVLFGFHSRTEISISDKIADGLSSINYYYLTEKNINEYMQIVTEITAKELGEQCGGFDCYSWGANNPAYKDLRDKFEETLRGKITGFPEQIGNGGRMSLKSPRISGLEMDEEHVKISMFPQQVYRDTKSFFVNASAEKPSEIDKQIRYLLLAKIGQRLYGNGTYARDSGRIWINSGKFDCDDDGKADKTINAKTKLSGAGLDGCKILDVNFNIDELDGDGKSKWNGYRAKCYGIQNSNDPGKFAGKVESEKLYAQIDGMLEKSLVCGIGGTDGLASITDVKGESSKSGKSEQTCAADEAKLNAWQNAGIDSKISSILGALKTQISETYPGITIDALASTEIESAENVEGKTPLGKSACDKCKEWKYPPDGQPAQGNAEKPSCAWHNENSGTFCWWKSDYNCKYSGSEKTGNTDTTGEYLWGGSSMCGNQHETLDRKQSWSPGLFSETESKYARSWKGDIDFSSGTYSCRVTAYFKFTFTPDISFRIADSTLKVVKKGTTDFEDLHFAVKFKPGSPYAVGGPSDDAFIPPATEYTCAKTSGQSCETDCAKSGKVSGSGTCETGKACCKSAENKIVISGEGKDITI